MVVMVFIAIMVVIIVMVVTVIIVTMANLVVHWLCSCHILAGWETSQEWSSIDRTRCLSKLVETILNHNAACPSWWKHNDACPMSRLVEDIWKRSSFVGCKHK